MSQSDPVLSHITLGTNQPERATEFYDAVLSPLGFARMPRDPGKPPVYAKGGGIMPYIYLYRPFDGRPATRGNGSHVAFLASTRNAVDAFYQAAMAAGGADEGPPGLRPHYSENYYAAYVRDPDGNKLQAVCYASE